MTDTTTTDPSTERIDMTTHAPGDQLLQHQQSSRVDPELVEALAAMPKAANGKLLDLSDIPALQEAVRALGETVAAASAPDPRVDISTLRLDRPDGSTLEIRLFRPTAATTALPALTWFHAGGQVVGSAFDDEAYHAGLTLTLNCVLAVVDYRLAPQTRAPGGAEDGYLAYAHLTQHGDELGVDPRHIGIGGASGGGAIAAAVALMVRDRGLAQPALLSLSYPMLDDRQETASAQEITDVGVWDREENRLAWQAVLGERVGAPDLDPYQAAGRATDLHALPPTFVAVGQLEVFRDEGIDFARRLIGAGVPVDLHVYGGAFHAWDRFAPGSSLTTTFEQTWHAFLRRHLHG